MLCCATQRASTRPDIAPRSKIQASSRCGCYFCVHTFSTAEIRAWVDSDQPALCAACGDDAVIGDASKHRLDGKFSRPMHMHFLSSTRRQPRSRGVRAIRREAGSS
jgi:hypothetical protein